MDVAFCVLVLVPCMVGRAEEGVPRDLGAGLLTQGRLTGVVFLTPNNTQVVAHQGSSLTLSCRLTRPPNSGLVTWSRRLARDPTLQVLSIGDYTHINDPRFLVVKKPSHDDWQLKVQSVESGDSGEYQCQATTHPPSHIITGVTVVEAYAAIRVDATVTQEEEAPSRYSEAKGPQEFFIKQGSQLQLVCELRRATEEPQFIFWYHDSSVVNHSPDSGKAVTDSRAGWGSTLLIKAAHPGDSGLYTCSPQAMAPDTVRVTIMETEGKQAAVQKDSTSSCPPSHSHLAFPLLLLFLLHLLHPPSSFPSWLWSSDSDS